MRRVKICTVCSFKSPVESTEKMLWVPVRPSVSAMLEGFSADQILEGDNAYNCPQCGRRQKAVERAELVSAPLFLVLVLRRIVPSLLQPGSLVRDPQKIKHLSPVSVCVKPSHEVELTVGYETVAVIHHEGTSAKGHYYAHINRQGRWFHCNDRAVTPSVTNSIGNDTAYVVFCKKVERNSRLGWAV